jgi:hypothetical protein
MASRFASALAVLLLAATLLPAAALADGDPASDVLLGQNVFYPYSPPTSRSLQTTLNAETAAAKKAGLPLKVAIIGSAVDLGVIPDLFGQPQKYANFLDQEISFHVKQPLLVVMAAGYGGQGLAPAATKGLSAIPKPAGKSSDDLARAAITAVAKVAAASGHPLKGVPGVSGSSGAGGSATTILVILLALAALATAAALVVVRRRQTAGAKSPR